jgi:hypothetical protein
MGYQGLKMAGETLEEKFLPAVPYPRCVDGFGMFLPPAISLLIASLIS